MSLSETVKELDAHIWHTLDSKQTLSGDEEDYIQNKLTTATVVEGYGKCLPIKDTLELQEICQKCWNAMALRKWPKERLRLKVLYRNLIAHLSLIGNNFFAPLTVRTSYFASHPREAEQCILICLKTAKNLSSQSMSEAAKELLEHATAISNCCARKSESRLDYLALEILFCQMHVLRDLKEFELSAEIAAQICCETQDHYYAYREGLLEFIFSVGEGLAAAEYLPSNGEDISNKVMNAEDERHEAYIRRLLQLSIDIQQSEEHTLRRDQALYGVTLLQIASSLMRSGLYAEALPYSEKAYEELRSFEPVLVQLKAHALLHHHEASIALFRRIVSTTATDLTLEEIFILASLVLRNNTELAEVLTNVLKEAADPKKGLPHRVSSPSEHSVGYPKLEEFTLGYFCLIFPLKTVWALREICTRLQFVRVLYPIVLEPYARFYFSMLWSMREWEAGCERLRALELALTFDKGASMEELDRVLQDLASLTFEIFLQTKEKEGVERCYRVFLEHRYVLLSIHSSTYLAQLALIVEPNKEDAQRYLRTLLTYDRQTRVEEGEVGGNNVAAALASLVNFFHSLGDLTIASKIAEMAIKEGGELTDEDRIDFLKVCALCLLCNAKESSDSSITAAALLTQHIIPTLKKRPAVDPSEYFWWCRFLCCISEFISDVEANVGFEIDCATVEIFQTNCDCSLEENKQMLYGLAISILEREFDFFVYGMPALSVENVASLILLTQEGTDSREDSKDMVTIFLSRIEIDLRKLPITTTMEEVKAVVKLEKLITAGASHYDLEALASAINVVGHQLDNDAVLSYSSTVQLSAASLYGESLEKLSSNLSQKDYGMPPTPDTLVSWILMYYRAYQMATSAAQYQEVLEAVKEKVLYKLSSSQMVQEHIEEWVNGYKHFEDAVGERIETILEYFAVDAWNRAVRFNAVHNREQMHCWRDLADTFAHVLASANPSRIAILDFVDKMPEM